MIVDEIYRDGKVEFTPDFRSVEPRPEENLEYAIELIQNSSYMQEILKQKKVYGIIHILGHIKEAIEAERKINE